VVGDVPQEVGGVLPEGQRLDQGGLLVVRED
jgi:hypothetical protein